jgi:hypothetical protein
MNTIPAEIVEKTWRKMAYMPPSKAPSLVNQLAKEQPLILAYLMAAGEDLLNQDEQELLLYLGMVVWQIMSQGDTPLPEVTEETLDAMEDINIKMLEYLEGESDSDFAFTVETIFKNYNQPEVLKYVIEALMEEEDEEEEEHEDETEADEVAIRDEMKGMLLIYLKTLIDCFDK